jgi:hypothetical protein
VSTGGASAILNCGFESGDLSAWTATSSGAGGWLVNDGSALPISGFAAPHPAEGRYDAAYDQNNPTNGVLYRDVVVPADGVLSFSFAYRNYDSTWVMDASPYNLFANNQWISIDVLTGGANPASFDPADIVTTVFRTTGSTPTTSAWQNRSVNLKGLEGQTVRLRFAVADTIYFLSLWVDAPFTVAAQETRTPEQVAYCTVAGNTWPDGSAIRPGTFVTLLVGQVDLDPNYKGAQVANYVYGMGLTCDQVPIGYTRQGLATSGDVPGGIYPFYGPALPAAAF